MSLVSIDPGVRPLGWALWSRDALVNAGCSRAPAHVPIETALEIHRDNLGWAVRGSAVAIESMVYRPKDSTPQDLIDVQTIGLGVAGMGAAITLYRASDWKGTIPKTIHHERIRAVLSAAERAVLDRALSIVPRGNRKEVLDAVGIGCYHLNRTNRSGGPRT